MSEEDLSYEAAMHGIQSGITLELHTDPDRSHPDWRYKDLRVGINSAHITDAAIATLLIEKGVFTEEEYAEAVRQQAVKELNRYENRHNIKFR